MSAPPPCEDWHASYCERCGSCSCRELVDDPLPFDRDPGCPLHGLTSRHAEPEEERQPSLDALLIRKERADRALQAAWAERARAHELLTGAGLAAGSLPERIADLLGELQEARALVRALTRAPSTLPTPTLAATSREETTHGQSTR